MTVDEAKALFAGAETFTFGDSEALCDALLALVRTGQKTATCAALREFHAKGETLPVVGQRDIALNWNGTPALVIETCAVEIRRFCDVDARFALAEGEDEDLAGWQAGHRAYFERNGGWSAQMELVCETFKLVRDFN